MVDYYDFLTIFSMKDTIVVSTVLKSTFNAVYQLYFQTHSCHWNIIGAEFYPLHEMLGAQYTRLWTSLDAIAERFRVIDMPAPTSIGPVDASLSTLISQKMLTELVQSQEAVIAVLRSSIETLTIENDFAGADLLTGLLAEHEKECWMTRSSISRI